MDEPSVPTRVVLHRHPPDFPWEWSGKECQYAPLNSPSNIRVIKDMRIGIKVERVEGLIVYSPEFACDLEVIDLDHEVDAIYTALSYSWGDPFPDSYLPTKTIQGEEASEDAPPRESFHMYCNGGTIAITKNLHDFLYSGNTRQDALLWIDAISINQQDIAERSSQVAMMDRIYAKAAAVLAWLGPHDGASETAIQLIERLEKAFESTPVSNHPRGSYAFNDPALFTQIGTVPITDKEWEAIILFFSRTWFRRMWMVQEVAFAARLYFACGEKEIQWTVLSSFVSWISDLDWDVELKQYMLRGSFGGDVLGTQLLQQVLDIGLSVRAGFGEARTRNLVRLMFGVKDEQRMIPGVFGLLLFRNQHRWATDPRDKVYGVLGMVKRYQEERLCTIPSPDYSKSTRQVFQESVEFILQSSASLGVLSLVENSEDTMRSEIPSWVTDWRVPRTSEPLFMHTCHDASQSWVFSSPQIDKTANLLSLEGLYLDTISSVSKMLGPAIGAKHDLMSVITPAFQVGDSYITGQHSFEVLFRTLVQDCFLEHCREPGTEQSRAIGYESAKDSFQSWLKYHIAAGSYKAGFAIPVLKADEDIGRFLDSSSLFPPGEDIVAYYRRYLEIFQKDPEVPAQEWNLENLNKEIWTPMRLFEQKSLSAMQRSLLKTERRLLGLVPPIAQTGDQIWILQGGRVPFVIRPQPNGHFRLIGEAYVHGCMKGEAFTRDKLRQDTAVTLTLE